MFLFWLIINLLGYLIIIKFDCRPNKHLLQLCHCWKETLLVTNTETQGTTEDAQNSAGDIIATWAHGGGAWLWNCCEHEKWQRFNATNRRKGAINWFVFLAAAVSLISTSPWGGFECSMNVWFLCCSVFLSAVDQRFSLHQQLSVSQLKFSLSLHLPLHVLPQGLKHTHRLTNCERLGQHECDYRCWGH